MIKRAAILVGVLVVVVAGLLLFSYDVLKIDFISFMEIQPAFEPMEDPLPVPARSIPIEGAAYPAQGAPENPVEADEISITRGQILFEVNCAQCHGATGEGNGVIANFLTEKKPADLTSEVTQSKSDGTLYLTVTNGVPGAMPALHENLTVRDRWDVVNYLRTLVAP